MLKPRARYAGILAAVSAPIYFVIQLLLGSDARVSLIRVLWFFLVVFLVSLAVKWEDKAPRSEADEPADTAEGEPGRPAPHDR